MKNNSLKNLCLLFAIVFMAGCSTPMPTLEFTPTNVSPAGRKIDADLKSISISIAQEKEKLGETQVGLGGNVYEQSFKSAFKMALEEGLARSAVFNDLSSRKVSLSAKVLKFHSPSMAVNFKTEMIVRYELISRESGKILFSKDLSSFGEVPYTYAFVGATRCTEARNISVRENVKTLISEMETLVISND